MYKYMHEILANNKKLYQMRIKNSPNCDHCETEDSNIHRFYQCCKVQKAVKWLKGFIEHISSMRFYSIIKLLSLEFPNVSKKIRNTMCIIICNFIASVWYSRDQGAKNDFDPFWEKSNRPFRRSRNAVLEK